MPYKLLTVEELGELPLIERARYAELLKRESARISYAISHPESKLAYRMRGLERPPKRTPRPKAPPKPKAKAKTASKAKTPKAAKPKAKSRAYIPVKEVDEGGDLEEGVVEAPEEE